MVLDDHDLAWPVLILPACGNVPIRHASALERRIVDAMEQSIVASRRAS